jgi:hypothetical protein
MSRASAAVVVTVVVGGGTNDEKISPPQSLQRLFRVRSDR